MVSVASDGRTVLFFVSTVIYSCMSTSVFLLDKKAVPTAVWLCWFTLPSRLWRENGCISIARLARGSLTEGFILAAKLSGSHHELHTFKTLCLAIREINVVFLIENFYRLYRWARDLFLLTVTYDYDIKEKYFHPVSRLNHVLPWVTAV